LKSEKVTQGLKSEQVPQGLKSEQVPGLKSEKVQD
jgi:hypothetical protein